jgi:phosphoglycerate dehydrogenase-like enzyme
MNKVFVLDSAAVPHTPDIAIEQQILNDCADVYLLRLNSDADFAPYAGEASGIILWHQLDLTASIIRRLRSTRIIVRNGVGYENVDVDAAAECGIPVANVPDYGTEEVADHAITMCLVLVRQIRKLLNDITAGNWRWQVASECRRIRGQVFGIVGCGRIGTATALRAKALGFDVSFFDPYVPAGFEKALGVKRENSLDSLLREADVLSLHVPLTEETRHMIDGPQLESMKETAILINTSRGPVVRHAALEQALQQKWIAGAGLDVLENEPDGLELSTRFENCILTPHSAFYSQESIVEMRQTSAAIVRKALVDNRFRNVVNGLKGASMENFPDFRSDSRWSQAR